MTPRTLFRTLTAIGLQAALGFSLVADAAEAQTKSRPDPLKYSFTIWPRGSVPAGQRVSAKTPYGFLTCDGGRGLNPDGSPRGSTGGTRWCRWAE